MKFSNEQSELIARYQHKSDFEIAGLRFSYHIELESKETFDKHLFNFLSNKQIDTVEKLVEFFRQKQLSFSQFEIFYWQDKGRYALLSFKDFGKQEEDLLNNYLALLAIIQRNKDYFQQASVFDKDWQTNVKISVLAKTIKSKRPS